MKRREALKAIAGGTVFSPALVCGPRPHRAAQVSAGGSKNPFRPVTKVELVKGVPTFTLDGKPWTQPTYICFSPRPTYYEAFAAAGTRIHGITTNNGLDQYNRSKATRPTADSWDFSEFDEHARRVVRSGPNTLVMPRIYVGTPRWWLAANPDEMELFEDGKPTTEGRGYWAPGPFPSLSSEKWRRDMGEGLAGVIHHIQASDYADRIFGYILVGLRTEEWYHWTHGAPVRNGYSRHTQAAFRTWLRRKYGTVEKLRAAWSNAQVDFDNAVVPSKQEREASAGTFRNPAARMNVIDFYIFWNEVIPETIGHFAGVVKKQTRGTKVCGAFYCYLYEFTHPEGGGNATHAYSTTPNLDFSFATAGYKDRAFAVGCDYQRAPMMSLNLHGKLWFHDNDLRTYLSTEGDRVREAKRRGVNPSQITNEELRKLRRGDYLAYGATDTLQETIWMERRAAAFTLSNGMYQSFFDLQPGWYNSPEMMAEVKRLNGMFERAARQDRSSVAEVLVVADDDSPCYFSYRSEMLLHNLRMTQFPLVKMGTQADHIVLQDLERAPLERYKLVVFLNVLNLTDETADAINRKLKRDNRTLLWCYAPGLFNASKATPERMSQIAGMKLVLSADETLIAPQAVIKGGHPIARKLLAAGVQTVGFATPCCKLISVEDAKAQPLGMLPGSNAITLAIKKLRGWTSAYAITSDLAPAFYRELARQAGVHIYNERDDAFYACKSYVGLHANGAGKRTITFPRACTVWDAINEEQVAAKTRQYSYDFKNGETIILRWS